MPIQEKTEVDHPKKGIISWQKSVPNLRWCTLPPFPEGTGTDGQWAVLTACFPHPPGIEFVVAQLKSMLLTLGLMDLRLTVEQAVLLSRLEEEYQVRFCSQVPPHPTLSDSDSLSFITSYI